MRLKEARKAARMTQAEVAKILGVNQNTYSYWENGKTKIDNVSLSKLAEIYNVSIDYLLDIQPPVKGVRVPVYGSVPAGIPLEAIENIEGYEEITPALASKGQYFALKIHGDSMSPYILDRDIVIVRRQDTVDSGDVAIVLVNGDEATCKIVRINQNGITLVAHNTLVYPPQFYSEKEITTLPVRIIGRVVEVKRSLI